MDNITKENSDSDLSEDWNIVDVKEAPLVISESESIEVLEEEDDDDERRGTECGCGESNNTSSKINGAKNELLVGERVQRSLNESQVLASRLEEDIQLVESNGNNHKRAQLYSVFPEEGYTLSHANYNSTNTAELLCSVSLVLLCTVASSLMVINADNLMPSFLDVLVWQSLPDNQKDMSVSNPALINQQLSIYREKNEILENKMNHMKLAVQALEENMISVPVFIDFINNIEPQTKFNEPFNKNLEWDKNVGSEDPLSVLKTTKHLKQTAIENENTIVTNKKHSKDDGVINMGKPEESYSKEQENVIDENKKHNYKKPSVKLFNKILTLFNTTSETGLLLNKGMLMLLESKDIIKKIEDVSAENSIKVQKIATRIQNIENNIDVEVTKFFIKLADKIHATVTKVNYNLKEFMCKEKSMNSEKMHQISIEYCELQNKDYTKLNSNTDKEYRKKLYHQKRNDDYKHEKGKNYEQLKWKKDNVHHKTQSHASNKEKDVKLLKNNYEKTSNRSDKYKGKDVGSNNLGVNVPSITNKVAHESASRTTDFYSSKFSDKGKRMNENKYSNKDSYLESAPDEEFGRTGNNNYKMFNDSDSVEKSKFMSRNESSDELRNTFRKKKTDDDKHYETDKYKNYKQKKSSDKVSRNEIRNKPFSYDKVKKNLDKFKKGHKEGLFSQTTENRKNNEYINNVTHLKNKVKTNEEKNWNYFKKTGKVKKIKDKSQKNSKKFSDKPGINEYNYKSKLNEKIKEIKQFKEDIINSIHKYMNDLVIDLTSEYNEQTNDVNNNSTVTGASTLLSGDWFLSLGNKRSEIREKEKKSDWLFIRAQGRDNLRESSDEFGTKNFLFHEKAMWFFRRAWERNRYRLFNS